MTLFDATPSSLLPRHLSDRVRVATRVRACAWPMRTFVLAVAGLFGVAALAYGQWLTDGAVVPWDSKNHFYPMFRFLGDALGHGTLPLWNPYHFGGYPAVADPQSLLFTPSMMLFALVAPDASMEVFDAVIWLHLVAGGVGMLGLARRWRWHPAAGYLTALIFMLGGAAASRLQHTGMIISYAWFPLALWSLHVALDRRSLRHAVLAGLLAALMALGRDQVAYLLCLALAGGVLRQAFRSGDMLAYLRGRLPVLACAGVVTVACMLVPILLTLQFLHDSNRPGIAYGMALEGSLDPINLLTLLSPNMFGSLDKVYDYWGPGAATVAGNDWTDRTIDYLFIGTLPLVLILWQGLAFGRLFERGARYFLLLFLAAMVYALGRHTPLFGTIFDYIPGVSLYRRPADATFPMNVALALASGYLLHRYIEEGVPSFAGGRLRGWIAPLAAVVGLALLVGAGLRFARAADNLDGSLIHLTASLVLVALFALALVAFRRRDHRGIAALVLVALTGLQLIMLNTGSPLNAEPRSSYSAYSGLYPDEARGLAVVQAELAARRAAGDHPRVEVLGLDGSWQNAAMVFKLEDTLGYNPLRISTYEKAIGVGESANDYNLRSFPDTFRGYNSRLAALLGLDYLILDRPIADLPRHFPRARATLLFSGVQFFFYRLDHAQVPRAVLAERVKPVDSDSVIDQGAIPAFAPGVEALIDTSDVARLKQGTAVVGPDDTLGDVPAISAAGSPATITHYGDNAVTISVEAAKPGVVVLHDVAYPGWTATVDGIATPMLRADLIFRGAEVPAGHHTVEFAFHPLSMRNLVAAAGSLFDRDKR